MIDHETRRITKRKTARRSRSRGRTRGSRDRDRPRPRTAVLVVVDVRGSAGESRHEEVGEGEVKQQAPSTKSYPGRSPTPGKPSLALRGATHEAKRRRARWRAGRWSLENYEVTGANAFAYRGKAMVSQPRISDEVRALQTGLWSSARHHMLHARKPGDLGGVG